MVDPLKKRQAGGKVTLLPRSCRAAGVKAGQSGKWVGEIASIPSRFFFFFLPLSTEKIIKKNY
jgi:hypothetical protein